MNWKKTLSLVLSAALSLSLAVPALAAERPEGWTPADGARVAAAPAQTTAELADYLANSGETWFVTGKTEYTVQAMMVSKETTFHNELEVTDYTVTDDGVSVVLKGVVGEQWVSKLEKVAKTYTKADGSEVTAADFAVKDTFIDLKTKAEADTNFAMHVPTTISVTVETAWGDVLHTNQDNAPHGDGDYLVCRVGEDGQPDLSDVWVVNGATFPSTYDMSRAPWYTQARNYVIAQGLMAGTDKGFEPAGLITKGTVFQTLYNMEGKPAREEYSPIGEMGHLKGMNYALTMSWKDVEGKWYADAAQWALETGVAVRNEEQIFGGDAVVDRGEVMDILGAYCDLKCLHSAGLMQGNESGDMMLDKTLTRAEFAQILVRLDGEEPYYAQTVVNVDVAEAEQIPAHTAPGTLCAPVDTQGKKFPAVVMLHGTGSNREEAGNGYQIAAPVMAENGIVTLRIDFMGNGDSTASYTDYCYTSANLDAKAAADYLAGLDYVDDNKIAVMGWSQGGTNALLAAAQYPETFKAVITWAGALTLNESTGLFGDKTFAEAKAIADKDGSYEMAFDWRDSLQVGKRWFQEVDGTDVEAKVADIKAPILAINGLADTTVDPANAEKIAAASKNEATRTYLIENCDHTYNVFSGNYAALYETVRAGIGFLQETLNGRLGPCSVAAISKYGNVGTDLSMDILAGAGYEVGDVLTVEITGQEPITLPLGTGYSNVDQGSPLALADTSNNTLAMAINRGDFATTYGLGVKGEDKVYTITEGVTITIAMAEKGGYLEEMEIREMDSKRTNVREDYASDEVFANFRAITLGDIAEGKLYRTSSPVNPELGRNTYADAFVEEAGVKTVVNLADSKEAMEGYEGYADTYYATLNVIPLNMGVDMYSEDAKAGLKAGFEYMIANEGPYAFHCTEGKDRAGYFAMVLEALMGADLGEIVDDYMLSFENYYHVEHHSEQWTRIAQSNIIKDLMKLAGVETEEALDKADLQKAAEAYLTGTIGLTADQVAALKTALSAPVA